GEYAMRSVGSMRVIRQTRCIANASISARARLGDRTILPGQDVARSVAAAAVGANLLAAIGGGTHQLAASAAVLHGMIQYVDLLAGFEILAFPAKLHQLLDGAAFERPSRCLACAVGDADVKPAVRIDEFEVLDGAGDTKHFRAVENGKGMVCGCGAGGKQR